MSLREAKGIEIADRARIVKSGNLYLVPSQSGKGKYTVNPQTGRCTCPDYDFRRQPCKHLYAVQLTVERERKTVTETKADGSTKTTVTERVTVKRKTYAQVWPAYNMAQTKEKATFLYLLHQLCQGIGSPAQTGPGQRALPLEDVIFAMAFKVYSTLSTRRFMTDLRDASAKGYVSQVASYNSIIRYFESEMLTDYLKMLIEESSLPLRAVEEDFAVDSTGISTSRFVRWYEEKYEWKGDKGMSKSERVKDRRDWIKVHLMCGVKTNVVTSVEISNRYAADTSYFKPLMEATRQNFVMNEVSGDKAYLSNANLLTAVENHAMPYIPFKSNSQDRYKKNSALWSRMYHYFSFKQDEFMAHYHKRSNVESTFMMIKTKFGDALRSKTERAQINEALCKVLCHNICCLIQSMYELNIKPKFYAEVA